LKKISEQELEEILNRILSNLERTWKHEINRILNWNLKKLDKILEIQNPERSFQDLRRNEQD
jgi:hypothetical protein